MVSGAMATARNRTNVIIKALLWFFAARPSEYRGMLNQGTDERLGAKRESLWRFPGVSRESEQEGSRRSRSKCLQQQAGLKARLGHGPARQLGGTGSIPG